jgi:hypothetical protein
MKGMEASVIVPWRDAEDDLFFGFYVLNQYRNTSETHFLEKQNFMVD